MYLKFKESFKYLFEDIYIDKKVGKLVFDFNKRTKDFQSSQLGKGNFSPRISKQKNLFHTPIYSIYQLSKTSGSEILRTIKKKSNISIKQNDYNSFLNRSAIYITAKLLKNVDVIVTPQTSSFLLKDILDKITAKRPDIKIIHEAFKKLPIDQIKINYGDYNVGPSVIKRMDKLISNAKEQGFIEIKNVPKQFLSYISNVLGINELKILPKYLNNQNVVLFDDLLGSGFTMKEMIINLKTYSPKSLKGITLFKT